MHPSFQERIDELGVLLQQTNAARAAFFMRPCLIILVATQVLKLSGGSFFTSPIVVGEACGSKAK